VSSPGNVTINSFGPLDVQQGITAGTASSCRPGVFPQRHASERHDAQRAVTYNTATGAFEVAIGGLRPRCIWWRVALT